MVLVVGVEAELVMLCFCGVGFCNNERAGNAVCSRFEQVEKMEQKDEDQQCQRCEGYAGFVVCCDLELASATQWSGHCDGGHIASSSILVSPNSRSLSEVSLQPVSLPVGSCQQMCHMKTGFWLHRRRFGAVNDVMKV